MAKIDRLQRRAQRLQTKIAKANARGNVARANRFQAKLAKIMSQIQITAGGEVAVRARGFLQIGPRAAPAAQVALKTYSVQLDKGAIKYVTPAGNVRTLGYTPAKAKKLYKTKRRRRRVTKRDLLIIDAVKQNPQAAGILAAMM